MLHFLSNKHFLFIFGIAILATLNLSAQNEGVSIDYSGTPTREPKAIFQTNSTEQGVILPRMLSTERTAIAPPASAQGMVVYQTDAPEGYYYWDGGQWLLLSGSTGSGYIENLSVGNAFATGQAASFDIQDDGEIGGTLKVGGNMSIGSVATTAHKLFVTGGSGYFVTGPSNNNQFTLARIYSTANFQELRVGLDDVNTYFHYINDESDARIRFRIENTDTESNGGANANDNTILTLWGNTLGGRVGINTVSPLVRLDIDGTDAIRVPGGTTAQRPTGVAGYVRFNSDSKMLEYHDGTQWVPSNVGQTPIGTIVPYAGPNLPAGWLRCEGAAVSRTTYAALYAAIGNSWGSGNGSTTFNLPDLRGRFARGVDGGASRDPDAGTRTASNGGGNTGANVGSVQADAALAHNHGVTDPGHTHTVDPASTAVSISIGSHSHTVDPPNTSTTTNGNHSHITYARRDSYGSGDGMTSDDTSNSDEAVYTGKTSGITNTTGNHSHTVNIGQFNSGSSTPSASGSVDIPSTASSSTAAGITIQNSTGSTETRPENAYVHYIIKAENTADLAIVSPNIPNGISGQTLRYDGSNWAANSTIFNTGTNVGIGTNSPDYRLQVSGDVVPETDLASDLGKPTLRWNNLYVNSISGPGALWTRSGSDLYNTNLGDNVGIGDASPEARLNIHTSDNSSDYPSTTDRGDIDLFLSRNNQGIEVGQGGASNARKAWVLARHNSLSYGKHYSSLHLQPELDDISAYRGVGIGYPASTAIPVDTYLAVKGKVGIGTTSPSAQLDVDLTSALAYAHIATFSRNRATDGWLSITSNLTTGNYNPNTRTGDKAIFFSNDNDHTVSDDSGLLIAPHSDSQSGLKIMENGTVGIGVANPTAKLHVGGTAGTDGIKFPDGSQQNFAAKCINTYFAITPLTRQAINSTTPQTITGLSVTLTPKSTSSKFLIMAVVNGTATYVSSLLIYRNGSKILTHGGNSDEAGSHATLYDGSNTHGHMKQVHIQYLDSPSTSSSITYTIRATSGWGGGNHTTYINDRSSNDMSCPSTLLIMEFAN